MKSHREFSYIRSSKILVAVIAVAGLGASPQEPWQAARNTLPPVVVAPNYPIPPAAPIPTQMPGRMPRVDRAVMPASNPVQGYPVRMPARPATSVPAPMAAPAIPAAQPQMANAPILSTMPNARVYVINGVDPFGWGGLSQMADRIRASGYPDTKFGFVVPGAEVRPRDPRSLPPGSDYASRHHRLQLWSLPCERPRQPVEPRWHSGRDGRVYRRRLSAEHTSNVPAGVHVVNVTGDWLSAHGPQHVL